MKSIVSRALDRALPYSRCLAIYFGANRAFWAVRLHADNASELLRRVVSRWRR